jgi:hypothetical protein
MGAEKNHESFHDQWPYPDGILLLQMSIRLDDPKAVPAGSGHQNYDCRSLIHLVPSQSN